MRYELLVLTIAVLLSALLTGAPDARAQQDVDSAEVLQLTLPMAIELALKHNETSLIAGEEVVKAKSLVTENRSAAWPHVTGIVGYDYNIEQPKQDLGFSDALAPLFEAMQLPPPPPTELPLVYKHNWTFTLDVQQNIYTFGRLTNAIRLANQYVSIGQEGKRIADQDVVMEVHDAYYKVLLGREVLRVAQENLKLAQEEVQNISAKVTAGVKSDFELLQARAGLAENEPNVIRAQAGLQIAKMNLLRVIGLPLDRPVDAAEDFTEFVQSRSVQEMLDEALANRREIALLNLQADSSHTTGNIFISNMLPFLTANMAYTQSGQSITDEDAFWPEDEDWYTFWSVGVKFTWPLFDGLESYGKVRQYRAQERIDRLKKAQAIKGIELEITQLAEELKALSQQVSARKESVAVAKKAYDLAAIRYDSGLGTLLEKNEAMTVWTRARLGHIQTLHDLNLTHAKLMRALGKDTF